MSLVTLGSTRIDANNIVYFYYDDIDYSSQYQLYPDTLSTLPTYSEGQVLAQTCSGTTKYTYKYQGFAPYSNAEIEENSTYCGYVPTVCDLAVSGTPITTDETGLGLDDGTVRVFATSSNGTIQYYLNGFGGLFNTTGYFTDLAPGDYRMDINDDAGCTTFVLFTINPSDSTRTHYKYRLAFESVLTNVNYELKFLDQKHTYDALLYPKDLTGTEAPIIRKTTNSDEDKTAGICPSSLTINVNYDGFTFTVLEFANAAERDWKIELYKNGTLDWQGWLLPDEIQDLYADPKYPLQFIATDGLLSLKGTPFGDLSESYIDANGIKQLIQQFGLRTFRYLWRICLEQLGYDYGNTTLISSLCYKVYNSGQWLYFSTWIDQFYDSDGISKDAYTAFDELLKGLHLQLFQHEGHFVIWDINDLFYRNNDLFATKFYHSTIEFPVGFDAVLTGTPPQNTVVGYNKINRPINPQQTLNYDKAFNQCEADIDFNLLALLYPNPNFEFNAVQNTVPYLLTATAGMNALSNYDPPTSIIGSGAYLGQWTMRTIGRTPYRMSGAIPTIQTPGAFFFVNDDYRWVRATDDFVIDQYNKKVNISFVWRPVKYSDSENVIPRISIFFTDTSTAQLYIYSPTSKEGVGDSGWFIPDYNYGFVPVGGRITDYLAWNSYSVSTDRFPGSGIGHVAIGIGTPLRFGSINMPFDGTIDYDSFVVTQSDANDIYNFQTGEKHNITNVTEYAKAEKKSVELSLYTYPNNKRLAGNVSYYDDYDTSQITNEWYFQLSPEQRPDRLPANVIKRIAKNYQRPMYKWQGDIMSDIICYYMIFAIEGIPNKIFIPFTIEMDLRNSVGNIVLIETDDTLAQASYNYLPIYEKSARNNRS